MRTTTTKISTVAVGLFLAVTIGILSTIPGVQTPAEARMPAQEQGTEPTAIDPGPGTGYIDPDLWSILQDQANGEGVPPRITIKLGTWSNVKVEVRLGKFIRSVGGKKVAADTWDVPTANALEIIQRPDVFEALIIQEGVSGAATIPANLDDTLGDIVEALDNKVVATSASQYAMFARGDSVVVAVKSPDAATIASIRAWLKKKDVYALPASETLGVAPNHLAVLLPVKHITELAGAFTTTRFEVATYKEQGLAISRMGWPQETKDLENAIINQYVQGTVAAVSSNPNPTTKEWEVDLASKLALHGVDRWHAMGYTGKNVKVGIIDWAFADWNEVAAIPGNNLPTMVTGAENGTTGANAYCQPITESVVPNSVIVFGKSDPCEPDVNAFDRPISHGVNVAELVMDMAPAATLLMAQANSPRQVYDAAVWLKSQGVDVIVHAGGWPYDSRGDGTAYFDLTHYNDATLRDLDEDSPRRYYPSPLYTVDTITSGSGAPVWVNAAGNAEEWTLNLKKPSLINDGDSDYHGYVIFNSTAKKHEDQTCQQVPITFQNVYMFGMRWSDVWPNGKQTIDYEMQRFGIGSGGVFLVRSQDREQHTTATKNYPLRKASVMSWRGYDVCLRIRVQTADDATPVAPNWIQFQTLVARNAFEIAPDWASIDHAGGSIVNPAESANATLLAVGARDMRAKDIDVFDYSSRGPVFTKGSDVINTSPGRIKPDLAAGSGAATYTKWLKECDEDASTCGDELYFGGTSGATAHTGGMAAVMIGYYDQLGVPLSASSVVSLLRLLAVDQGTTGTDNTWGRGFLELPCPGKTVSLPYTSSGAGWQTTDCESEAATGRSDYYVFNVPTQRQIAIEFDSTTHAHLRLARSTLSQQTASWTATNGSSGGEATISRQLKAGIYILEVATNSATATGAYTLEIMNQALGSVSPLPSSVSFKPDDTWHKFTVSANVPVKIVVNPTGSAERFTIATSKPNRSYCPADEAESIRRTSGQTFYLEACSAGNGTIEVRSVSDDKLLASYSATATAVTVTPRASLSPRPSSLKADGKWKAFTVSSNVDIEVEVNPTGTTPRIELTTSSTAGNHCSNGAENEDDVDASNGDTIYLAGCATGTGTVRLLRKSDGKVIATYSVTITAATVTQVCEPVTNIKAVRSGSNAVVTTWTNPNDGVTATGRLLQIRKWNPTERVWKQERNINEPASATSSRHIGAAGDSYYAYRVWSKCGTTYSTPTGWKYISPIPGDASRGASDDEIPTPTPQPSQTPDDNVPEDDDEPRIPD